MSVEMMRKRVELMKVKASEAELELRIAMAKEEIARLEKALVVQMEAAQKLELEYKQGE